MRLLLLLLSGRAYAQPVCPTVPSREYFRHHWADCESAPLASPPQLPPGCPVRQATCGALCDSTPGCLSYLFDPAGCGPPPCADGNVSRCALRGKPTGVCVQDLDEPAELWSATNLSQPADASALLPYTAVLNVTCEVSGMIYLEPACPQSDDCCVATYADCAAACAEVSACIAFRFKSFLGPNGPSEWCPFNTSLFMCTLFKDCPYRCAPTRDPYRVPSLYDYFFSRDCAASVTPPPQPPPPPFPPPFPPLPHPPPSPFPLQPPLPPGSLPSSLRAALICLGIALCIALCASLALLLRRRHRSRAGHSTSDALAEALLYEHSSGEGAAAFEYDVFLSYRRSDFVVCDLVAALLELEGVRAFLDRSGLMAGQPFDQELAKAIMGSAAFTPVVTLPGTQALSRVDELSHDFPVIEILVALHFKLTGRIQKIYPLLVGEMTDGIAGVRDVLSENSDWKLARDAIPSAVPYACIDAAASLVRLVAGEELVPCLHNVSVWELMCATATGRGEEGAFVEGVFTHDWCLLTGREQDMGLYIRNRFAKNLMRGRGRARPG